MQTARNTNYWLTWGAAALRNGPDQPDSRILADALGVSPRTVRHWKQTGRAPAWVIRILMMLVNGVPAYAQNWTGYRFQRTDQGAALVAPNGAEFSPEELAEVTATRASLRKMSAAIAPGAQLKWEAPSPGRASYPGAAVPTWRQLEDALRVVVADVLEQNRDR